MRRTIKYIGNRQMDLHELLEEWLNLKEFFHKADQRLGFGEDFTKRLYRFYVTDPVLNLKSKHDELYQTQNDLMKEVAQLLENDCHLINEDMEVIIEENECSENEEPGFCDTKLLLVLRATVYQKC